MSRAQVCRDMCAFAGMPDLWTEDGPTALAESFAERPQGRLAGCQLVIFQMAWALWHTGVLPDPDANVEVQHGKLGLLEDLVKGARELSVHLAEESAG